MIPVLICFLIPLLAYFKINLVGEVTVSEVALIVFGLINIRKCSLIWRERYVKWVVFLGIAWLLSAIVSDIYRDIPSEDFMRGWARIVVLMCSVFAVGSCVGSDKNRIAAFAMGQYLSIVLYSVLYPVDAPFYKFIIGFSVSGSSFILCALFTGYSPIVSRFIPFIAGCLALYFNARSLAGITLLASAYPWLYWDYKIRSRVLSVRVLIPMFALALLGVGIVSVYKISAGRGWLGDEALNKYTEQTSYKTGEFSIFEGRSEVLFSWPKIKESPIVGWGSWAKDLSYVQGRRAELGIVGEVDDLGGLDLIPSHSHFFGAWLEAGLMGAIFWLSIFAFVFRAILSNGLSFLGVYRGLGVFLLITFLWDILFSPFGGERRLFNGFLIWVVIVALSHADRVLRMESSRVGARSRV